MDALVAPLGDGVGSLEYDWNETLRDLWSCDASAALCKRCKVGAVEASEQPTEVVSEDARSLAR